MGVLVSFFSAQVEIERGGVFLLGGGMHVSREEPAYVLVCEQANKPAIGMAGRGALFCRVISLALGVLLLGRLRLGLEEG